VCPTDKSLGEFQGSDKSTRETSVTVDGAAEHDSVVPAPWSSTAAIVLDVTRWLADSGSAPAEEVLLHVLETRTDRPDLDEVEDAVNGLVSTELLSASTGGFELTSNGKELLQRVRRVQGASKRLARLQGELATVRRAETVTSWRFGGPAWSSLIRRHIAETRHRLGARKTIVDGLIIAIERLDEVNAAVRSAPDRSAALALLTRAPFPFTEMQAHHVLDMTVSRQTAEARTALADESTRLAAEMESLDDE